MLDIERIAPCLPGAELQEVEGDEYRGVVKVKVGPITAQYKGTAKLAEVDEAAHRLLLDASGRDTRGQGNAKAKIVVNMAEDGDGTKVDVATDLSITGKVAQFGRGVLADVSSKLMGQFVENLERDVLSEPATPSATDADSDDEPRRRAERRPTPASARSKAPRPSRSTSSMRPAAPSPSASSPSGSASCSCSSSGASSATPRTDPARTTRALGAATGLERRIAQRYVAPRVGRARRRDRLERPYAGTGRNLQTRTADPISASGTGGCLGSNLCSIRPGPCSASTRGCRAAATASCGASGERCRRSRAA